MITESDVRARATAQSFQKGKSYFHSGAIFDVKRYPGQIAGRCQGSAYMPYKVQVSFDADENIVLATCTCPYDWGGDCKHIVALLLTYIHQADRFPEAPPVKTEDLLSRSKEELVAIIQQMINREPDLAVILKRPLPGFLREGEVVDVESYRQEVRWTVREVSGWDEYGYGEQTLGETLQRVAQTAAQFGKQGDWPNAVRIYEAILQETLEVSFDTVAYDDLFYQAIESVIGGLSEALGHPEIVEDQTLRHIVLFSLLSMYLWNIEQGGYDIGGLDEVDDILGHVRPEDINQIRDAVTHFRENTRSLGSWGGETIARFLIELDALDDVDPDTIIKRLREDGSYIVLFDKLLDWKRYDEAAEVIREHLAGTYQHLAAIAQLAQEGERERGMAIRLAENALEGARNVQVADWLIQQYQETGETQKRFHLLQRSMEAHPTLAYYVDLRRMAGSEWPAIRQEILQRLAEKGSHSLLVDIYLDEEAWDEAWEVVDKVEAQRQTAPFFSYRGLMMRVAEATESVRPRRVVPIYVQQVRTLIGHRGRDNYADAARLLTRVRKMYRELDESDRWDALIGEIRSENSNLPALQDELNKAKL
jgi:uncharacterized Zn finger protein